MTQLQAALVSRVTPAMEQVAHDENLEPEAIRQAVAAGRAVIPLNPAHRGVTPVGVGRMFRTKVNANLGRSQMRSGCGTELDKLRVALAAGADFVMDLSVGPDLRNIPKTCSMHVRSRSVQFPSTDDRPAKAPRISPSSTLTCSSR